MRLGGPIFKPYAHPEEWVRAVRETGYSAAYCPVDNTADAPTIAAYEQAAKEADILIAEVGAWSNPISRNDETKRQAIDFCKRQLELAEAIGANCCVNIAGSLGEQWDGPHENNLTPETFELIVETTQDIIDSVGPARTFFSLETMPWSFPDSVQSYADLVMAIERRQFGVHWDPVNLVNSPRRYYENAAMTREAFAKLGPHMKSCHGKDILLRPRLTTHLDEVQPGEGGLDYGVFLTELDKLDGVPLMLEHLQTPEEYDAAAGYIRSIAREQGVTIQ